MIMNVLKRLECYNLLGCNNLMRTTLQSYYHCVSPQRALDKQIGPIISHLQQNNVNSLHQLKQQLQKLSPQDSPQHFNKTLPVFGHPNQKIRKFHSTLEKGCERQQRITNRGQSFTISPRKTLQAADKQRIILVSPVSKVKKHLIDQIDVQAMKQALFKKRATLNRFQVFCQYIKDRDRSKNKNDRIQIKKQKSLMVQEFDSKENQTSPNYRITTRRRFWRQNKTPQQNQGQSDDILSIRALHSTIQHI